MRQISPLTLPLTDFELNVSSKICNDKLETLEDIIKYKLSNKFYL
jgi:hypothetical protein